jgi:hypothetical protein
MANEISNAEIQQVVGKPIYSHDGEEVGRLEQVIERGGNTFAILDLSDHFHTDDRKFAVPWDRLDMSRANEARLTIEVNDETLENAEMLSEDDDRKTSKQEQLADVYVFTTQVHWPS